MQGLTRLTFQPYTFKQLQEIVCSRLEGLQIFEPDAVELASRKVSTEPVSNADTYEYVCAAYLICRCTKVHTSMYTNSILFL